MPLLFPMAWLLSIPSTASNEPCNPVHAFSFSALFLFLLPSCPAGISFHKVLGFPIQHCCLSCCPSNTSGFCSYLPFPSPAGYCLFIFSCHSFTFSSGSSLLYPPDCQHRTDTAYSQMLCQPINLDTGTKSCFSANFLLCIGSCLLSFSPGMA